MEHQVDKLGRVFLCLRFYNNNNNNICRYTLIIYKYNNKYGTWIRRVVVMILLF